MIQLLLVICALTPSLCNGAGDHQEAPRIIHLEDSVIIPDEGAPSTEPEPVVEQKKFEPFTGKVTGSKVRLRLQPNIDSPIITELFPGDFWIVTGEIDAFFAVLPKPEMKGYIFRTYVLDGIIEGDHVNMRLKPDLQSPILTQLGQGDHVHGAVSVGQPKWFEAALPKTIRFYIAKEYVQRIGPQQLYHELEKKHAKFEEEVLQIREKIVEEMKKPFHDIRLAPFANQLKSIAAASKDFQDISIEVQSLITKMQDEYLELSLVEQSKPIDVPDLPKISQQVLPPESKQLPSNCTSAWLEKQESDLIQEALSSRQIADATDFYAHELQASCRLKGKLIRYERQVQNRPGNFILIDPETQVPLAYVYSTREDLTRYTGSNVNLLASQRPNHGFALPAYYVLEASAAP